jgi:uncharacterized membrane protein
MTDNILLGIIFLCETLLFYFLPVFNGKDTLFGLVLKESDFLTEGLPILKKYRRDLSILFFLFIIGYVLNIAFSPNSLAFIYIFATFLNLALLFKYLRQSWQLRDRRVNSRLATSLKPRNLKDFTYLWLEATVILMTLLPFAVLIHYYPEFPDVVPVHWNAAGQADGWEKKSFFSVFFPAMLAFWLQIFFLILKQDIIQARLRVPAEDAETILSLKEISLRANVGLIDWCRLFGGILLTTTSLLIISTVTAIPLSSVLNTVIWTSVVLLISGIGFCLYRITQVNREIKSITGQIIFQTAEEMKGWNTAGLFYYNTNDAAFMIEKPGGVGYTFNFAHKRSLIYLALILLPLAFVFLGEFFSKK